jgi:hypothetical protein
MGDTDKNIVAKLVDTINDVVETVTTTAADALSDAMKPDQVPEKRQSPSNQRRLRKRSPRKQLRRSFSLTASGKNHGHAATLQRTHALSALRRGLVLELC